MSKEQILKNNNFKLLQEFNSSVMFDKELYPYDIAGSIAHSKMLLSQGILTQTEQQDIENGLKTILQEIEKGQFVWKIEDEDLHMAIESRLIELIGDTGKKLHTARSRNDQVITDFRLYVLDKTALISQKLQKLIKTIIKVADKNSKTIMPGMTHLQHAQPINFGYHLLAYANMFRRDIQRLLDSYKRNNISPLGCAALAGTPHDIDRFYTAKLLGFSKPSTVCLDTVSDRDFALDMLYNISTIMMHISRFSEELILWSSYEFRFVTIDDRYATTSSIMPQKKNPDVPELLRGKTGRVYGNLVSLLTVMKSLPLAYNKDTQEDKEGVFDSTKTVLISIDILNEVIKTLKVNKKMMKKATKIGHLTATDLADYLVKYQNIPFREAYYITKDIVKIADKKGCDISELSLEDISQSNPKLANIDKSVLKALDLVHSLNSRNSYGGTSTKQTKDEIKRLKKWLKKVK